MRINPVVQKDLKTKLRGWRTPVLISSYVILLTAILFLFFSASNMMDPVYLRAFNPRLAVNGYNLLIVFQFALLFLAVPAITATSISGERERQTLDLMLVTKTPPVKIITGKIIISIAHTMLLLISSMPVLGAVFFFGGIGFEDILKLLLFYVVTAFFVASLGVFVSTLFRRNIMSIITTYILAGLITFGPFIFLLIRTIVMEARIGSVDISYADLLVMLFPSPVFGFTSFYYSPGYGYGYGVSIWGEVANEIENLIAEETGLLRFMEPWIANSLFSIVASVLLILLSASVLNPIKRKK